MRKNKIVIPKKAIKRGEESKQISFFSLRVEDLKVEAKKRSDRHFTKGMPFTIKL